MPHSNMKCYIAGVLFEINNIGVDKFNANFLPFLHSEHSGSVDGHCVVNVQGAIPALRSLKSAKAWCFEKNAGVAVLSAANPGGDLLWRMSGREPFDALTFGWNPDAFFETYNNAQYGSYGIIVILALVLRLLELQGVVLHCAAAVVDNAGIICTGRSGQGKSTISGLLESRGVAVLTDERAVIRVKKDGLRVYGTPWPSSEMCVLNSSAPLKKLYFIEHGSTNKITRLEPGETLKRLLDVVMVPWMNSHFFDPLIEVLEAVVEHVPAAVLSFVPDRDVVDFIKKDLKELS